MKVSNKVGLIAVIVVVVIALAVLFTIYFRQVGERSELNDRLDTAQILLPGLAANKESLEDQLTQARSSLDISRVKFPESVESIEYDDDLFEIADDCNVDIISIVASMPTNKKVGAVTYSVAPFTVKVRGDVDDILDFIYAIRTGDDFQLPWSAEVTKVNIAIASGGTQATINLNIYGYKR